MTPLRKTISDGILTHNHHPFKCCNVWKKKCKLTGFVINHKNRYDTCFWNPVLKSQQLLASLVSHPLKTWWRYMTLHEVRASSYMTLAKLTRNISGLLRKAWLPLLLLKPTYPRIASSKPWLPMPWFLASPGHQQQWQWPFRIEGSLYPKRKNFIYLCYLTAYKPW